MCTSHHKIATLSQYAVWLLSITKSPRAKLCLLWPAASATQQPRLLPSALFLCRTLFSESEIKLVPADVLLLSSSQNTNVSLHVLVSPQNCRNFIICCATSARHKQQDQKAHDDSLTHRKRRIKASSSRVPFFFFTHLFIVSRMANEPDPCSSSLLPKNAHDSVMCASLATNIQQNLVCARLLKRPYPSAITNVFCAT